MNCARCGGPKEWGMFCAVCREQAHREDWLHAHTIYVLPNVSRAKGSLPYQPGVGR